MSDVFISYGRSTAKQAQAAAGALRRLGYSVWIDDELPGHLEFADVIQEQIDQAKAVVVIWSGEAVKSQWVRSEANRARGHSKLVQLALDHAALPMPFDQIQCLNLAGWTGVGEHRLGRRSSPASKPWCAARRRARTARLDARQREGASDDISPSSPAVSPMSPRSPRASIPRSGTTSSLDFSARRWAR